MNVDSHHVVDPDELFPDPEALIRWDLGYLGSYSADRQPALDRLLLEPARQNPELRCVVAGPDYPDSIDWPENVERIDDLPERRAFYNALRWAVAVTPAGMVHAGRCPSVQLLEAAACATPVISDIWPGIEEFFTPCTEITLCRNSEDVLETLRWMPEERRRLVGSRARERVLTARR